MVGSAGMAAAQEKAQLAGSEIGRAKLVCIVTHKLTSLRLDDLLLYIFTKPRFLLKTVWNN